MWWENASLKVIKNQLYVGEHSVSKIAQEQGTPLFLYLKNQIQANYRALKKAFNKHTDLEPRICYAMKANSNVDVLKLLKTEGTWIDAVSPGEVAIARNVGFPGSKIFFTGTSLSQEDLRKVLCFKDIIINIDAEEQLDLLLEVKEKWFPHREVKICIRWNPGVGKGFNPKVITAGDRSPDGTPIKFGVEESKVIPVFFRAADMGFSPIGLHQHLGSGWVEEDLDAVKNAVDLMIIKAKEIVDQGFKLEFLDFGGGFGPRYAEDQGKFPIDLYIEYISKKISRARLEVKAIAVEPGKYLIGDAGILLLRVEYVKTSYGSLIACVNGGTFNTVPRPAIYTTAQHEIINCSQVQGKDLEKITIAGNLCETGDVFGTELLMPVPQRGDILALLCAGAYCRSMASFYNSREIPPEIIV